MADKSPRWGEMPLDLVLLAMAAGGADAAGYMGLGQIFTANMTGNIVLLGIAVSEGHNADTWRALFALLAYIVGTCAGAWLCRGVARKEFWAPSITRVICCEAVTLLAFAVIWAVLPPADRPAFSYPLLALLGLSMGLQGAAVYRLGVRGIATTTVVTTTLTSVLAGIMQYVHIVPTLAPDHPSKLSSLVLQTLVIVIYCAGAAVSGFLMLHATPWTGFFPVLLILAVIGTRLGRD